MKKLLTLIFLAISSLCFGQRITDNTSRIGYLELRANKYLHIPNDTVRSDAINADPEQQLGKKNGRVYQYSNGQWVSLLDDNSAILDSVRRSNDTLYFRKVNGGEIAIKMTGIPQGNITGLTDSLLNKPTVAAADLRYKPITYAPSWSEVTGKPTTFPPSAHTHVAADVTGLVDSLGNRIDSAYYDNTTGSLVLRRHSGNYTFPITPTLNQVVAAGVAASGGPGDSTLYGVGAKYFTTKTGTSLDGVPHYRLNVNGFSGDNNSRGQMGLFGIESGGNTGSNLFLGGVKDDGVTTIRYAEFYRTDSSARLLGRLSVNNPTPNSNYALNVKGRANISDSVFIRADTAMYLFPVAQLGINSGTNNIVRTLSVGNRVLVPKTGDARFFGDSQLLGANGSGNPLYSDGTFLFTRYRPTVLFCNSEGRSLNMLDYTLGSTKISWFNAEPFVRSIFNATGLLDTTWTGVAVCMPAWNNLGNDVLSSDTTFWSVLQRAHEAMIARLLCDNWGGVGITGLSSANVAGTNSWTTNGTALGLTVPNSESHRINPFYFGQPTIGTKVFMGLKNGEFLRFTLKGKKDVGLFYETTPTGAGFTVSINGITVYTGNSKFVVAQDNTQSNGGRYPGVVWLENVPDSAVVQMTSTGTISDTTIFLGYGYTEKADRSNILKKVILYGSSTGNLKSHNDTILNYNAIRAQQACQTFADYPVYFANPYNYWQNSTDRDPVDSFHLTPSGSQHVVEAFNMATKQDYKPNLLSRPQFNLDSYVFGNLRTTGAGTFSGNVTTTGSIGIGTTSPAAPLTIFNGTDGGAFLSIQSNGNSVFRMRQTGSYISLAASGTGMVVKNTGEVGANTTNPVSSFDVVGSIGMGGITTVTANTTLNATMTTVRATTSGITLTLPAASSCPRRIYVIVNYNTGGSITTSSFNNNGAATTSIANNTKVWLQSDGTNWYQIN